MRIIFGKHIAVDHYASDFCRARALIMFVLCWRGAASRAQFATENIMRLRPSPADQTSMLQNFKTAGQSSLMIMSSIRALC